MVRILSLAVSLPCIPQWTRGWGGIGRRGREEKGGGEDKGGAGLGPEGEERVGGGEEGERRWVAGRGPKVLAQPGCFPNAGSRLQVYKALSALWVFDPFFSLFSLSSSTLGLLIMAANPAPDASPQTDRPGNCPKARINGLCTSPSAPDGDSDDEVVCLGPGPLSLTLSPPDDKGGTPRSRKRGSSPLSPRKRQKTQKTLGKRVYH